MWILILTIITSHGVSVVQVPSFKTKSACVAAGELWQKTVSRLYTTATAVCVPNMAEGSAT
jgi:hypothetical protein